MDETDEQLSRLRPEGPPATLGKNARPLRVLVVASMLSKVADWQLGIVIPLAILAQTGSVASSLISFALRGVAYVASPFLGSLIDRFDKRIVFSISQFQQALCLLLLAGMLDSRVAASTLLLLSGFGAVAATITGQFVIIPELFHPERRSVAVAKLGSAIEFAKVIGLVLGGLAISGSGPGFASLFIAVLYTAAGLVALLLPRIPSRHTKSTVRQDLGIGFRWLAKPQLLWLMVTLATINLAIGQLEPALVANFGDEGIDALVISSAMALGLFMGAVANRLGPHILPSWTMERRIFLFQLVSLTALCVVACPGTVVKMVGYAFVAFASGAMNVASITYRQEAVPVEIAGRVNSVIRMFITGAIPLSGLFYAWSSHLNGFRMWIPALLLSAASVIIWGFYTYCGTSTPEPESIA